MSEIEKHLAALAELKDKVTEETLVDTGRYFNDHYCDLTQCHHGDTGNYRNDNDGKAVALLWNLWKAGALDQLTAPPSPQSRNPGDPTADELEIIDMLRVGAIKVVAADRSEDTPPPVPHLRGIAPDEAHANVLPSREDRGGQTDQLEALSFSAHLTPQMIRDTAYWEQLEDELRETLRRAANALEVTEEERAKQWRLRREAEASRDAARAVADSLAMARDTLRSALRDAADQLSRAHDDAFKQAAGYGLVTSDGREFSCYQLNLCQTAANKARAALATTEGSDNG